VHTPTEDKTDDIRDNFYKELELVFYQFLKHHTKILLGDFTVNVGPEDIFKPTTRNENLHKISTDNGVRMVNCATLKISLSKVQCSHITTFINTLELLQMGKHNQFNHILIDKR
jgi:hypothetical protein